MVLNDIFINVIKGIEPSKKEYSLIKKGKNKTRGFWFTF